jgi:mannosyltransferase OCH1-like enzyme
MPFIRIAAAVMCGRSTKPGGGICPVLARSYRGGRMIERLVHRIWFGPHKMRDELVEYGKSWEQHGYTVQLWTEDNLPELRNQAVYDDIGRVPVNVGCGVPELGTWVQRADVVSYELIHRFGGIYANTDMECLKSLDPILEGVEAFAGWEVQGVLSNALMGCEPQNEFFDHVISELPGRFARERGSPMSIATGPHHLTSVHERIPGLTVFPRSHFIPYGYEEMDEEWLPHPDAFTSHHWGHTRGLVSHG